MTLIVSETNVCGQPTAVVLARFPLIRDTARLHSLCSDLESFFPNETIAIVTQQTACGIISKNVFCENSTVAAYLLVNGLDALTFRYYVLS